MSKIQGKVTAYIDAFIRHDSGANVWALLLDSEGRTVSEVIRRVNPPEPGMRSARLAAVRLAMESAYNFGVKEIEVMLPDASLAMSLDLRKPVESALFPQFISLMALRHIFRYAAFKPGTIDTLSTLSLSMA
jgi:hypothetical protein